MSNLLSLQEITFDHLLPADEDQVLDALQQVKNYQSRFSRTDIDHLERTMARAASWRLPALPFLVLLTQALLERQITLLPDRFPASTPDLIALAQLFSELRRPAARHKDSEDSKKVARLNRLRRLFILNYTQLEIGLLVVADHITRMEIIHLLPPAEARQLAEDNEIVFLPLLEMFGMWELRRQMGDSSLKILNPQKLWDRINRHKEKVLDLLQPAYLHICEQLTSEFINHGIQGKVSQHETSPSSIYRRFRRGESFNELVRQLKVDVTVPQEADCYQVLRLVHQKWPPLGGRTLSGGYFRDLIAMPKFTGYRSLVTTVNFPRSEPNGNSLTLEVRIFTEQMLLTNMEGVVAQKFRSSPPLCIKNAWWEDEKLIQFVRDHPPGSQTESVYVFSPNGKVNLGLKWSSTPIDYAYHVHSEVGNHCKRIWVNGHLAPYNQILANGDLVEIEVDPEYHGPDKRWEAVVQTSTARAHIKRALRKDTRPKGRQTIDRVLDEEMKNYHLQGQISPEEIQRFLEEEAVYFGYSDLDALYLDIAASEQAEENRRIISPNQIVARLITRKLADHIIRVDGRPLGVPPGRVKLVQCRHGTVRHYAAPGAEIVGRLVRPGTPHEQLCVYRKECPNAPAQGEAIALDWLANLRQGEPVRISIQAVDRSRLLGDVLDEVYTLAEAGIYLLDAQAKVTRERDALIQLTLEAPGYSPVELLSARMGELKRVGLIDDFQIEALSPLEKMILMDARTLPNPYTSGPVRDRRLFKGRDAEIKRIISSLQGDQNLVVLYGINRVGKTSLLRYLKDHVAQEYNFLPALIDLPGIVAFNEDQLWKELAGGISQAVSQQQRGWRLRFHPNPTKGESSPYENFRNWLEAVKVSLQGRRLLVMIDELNVIDELWPDQRSASQTLYHLKSLIETEPDIKFIFCVQEALYRRFLLSQSQPTSWSLLRTGIPLRLDHMDSTSSEKLIREPMGQMLTFDEPVIPRILHLTANHPYYLQNLLHHLVNHVNELRRTAVVTEDLDAAVVKLLENGHQLFYNYLIEFQGLKQVAVIALASLSSEGNTAVPVEVLHTLLVRHQVNVHPQRLTSILEHMREIGVVVRPADPGKPKYAIRVPLFAKWLGQNYPLSLIEQSQRRDRRGKG